MMSPLYNGDEQQDLANPKPRRSSLALLAIIVGLLVLGGTLVLFFLVR